jgi:cystathionine gamma-lyase
MAGLYDASPVSERPAGPSTRAVHAGRPPAEQGAPLLPGPVLAAPFHLRGDVEVPGSGYGRDTNPTWTALEAALGALDGGESVTFASGMAAVAATVLSRLRPGDLLVASADGYPGVRKLAAERLVPMGVEVRLVPTVTAELVAAAPGAAMLWVETPSNPGLRSCDLRAVAEAASAAGALLAVDNTLATALGQPVLDLGADLAVSSGTKLLSGHSDVLFGVVSVRDPELAAGLRAWRTQVGAILGPFEAWLAHRSLATLGLRLERSSANALAVARALRDHGGVADVRHPGLGDPVAAGQMRAFGPLVGFTLPSAAAAQAFLDACELVAEATSFGGVESTAERRARWGTDAVPEGFIRFSAGCEDTADLVADVLAAADAALRTALR